MAINHNHKTSVLSPRDYLTGHEFEYPSVSLVLDEVGRIFRDFKRNSVYQLGLPGMGDYHEHFSGYKFFIIAQGKLIDFDSGVVFPENIERFVEEVESHNPKMYKSDNTDIYLVCFSESDYANLSSIMKRKANLQGGITAGWGDEQYRSGDSVYRMFTYSRNPTHAPPVIK